MVRSLLKVDTRSKCLAILFLIFTVFFLLAWTTMSEEDSTWERVTIEEATTGAHEIKTTAGMRGDIIRWKKVK